MDEPDKENLKTKRKFQKISEDTYISELMELPEFRYWPRVRNRLSKRVHIMLNHVKNDDDINASTLKEFRNYIQEHGWKRRSCSRYTRFPNFGEKSIKYFNNVLKKYGAEPLGPLSK